MHPTLLMLALLLAAAAALVLAAGMLRQARRDERSETVLAEVLATRRGEASPLAVSAASAHGHPRERWLDWLESIGTNFNGSRVEAALLTREDCLLLDQCGLNHASGRAAFLGLRVALVLGLPLLVALWQTASGSLAMLQWGIAAGVGLLLPKFVLRAWAERVRKQAIDELPVLVDVLRLLQGVGMSIDQSLSVIADQFVPVIPRLGREVQIANLAYSRGRSREQSLQRLAEVLGSDDLRSLVSLLVQIDRYGGAVQEPLRLFGERLRERRRMNLKEAVGRLSVKMTLVMMLTLLPALMMVLAGPAIIALGSAIAHLGEP
jgi:tight adherence protein C